MIRVVALLACLLVVCITASSAFIRHWQNGVGCEGWPACYRTAQSATHGAASASAAAATPAPVRIARALHRVSATMVGVLVLLVAVFGWSTMGRGERIAAALALLVTVLLAWLGRYTPHDLPLVTLANLLGGLLLAAALAWIAAARRTDRRASGVTRLAVAALALLGLLAWGGTMIGARHAIDACPTPLCLAGSRLDAASFDPMQAALAIDAAAAQGLHVAHRAAGLALALVLALLALRLRAARPATAAWLALLGTAQLLLGAATALGAQALLTATLHNAIAALLAVALAGVAASGQSPRSARSSSARSA